MTGEPEKELKDSRLDSNSGLEDLPVTVNLLALAEEWEARGGKRKTAGALRRAWTAQSCLADLRRAQGAVDALDQLARCALTLDPSALLQVQSALLSTAILLYSRATWTGSGKAERGAIKLDSSKLTAEQLKDHHTLIRLRNGAVGHVHKDERIAGDHWHEAFLFAKRTPEGDWEFGSGYTGIGFQFEALRILVRQLPVAIRIVRAKVHERLNDARLAMNETRPSEATLMRHQVDPAKWFGSPHHARIMLGGGPGEEIEAWMPLLRSPS